jgi:chaperonin GroES
VTEAYAYEPEGPEAGAPEQDEAQTGADVTFLQRAIQSANLAADLDPSKLSEIGSKVCQEFKIDLATRVAEGWEERYKSAMDLALQVKEEKSYPWPKASNIKYPLLSTAAIQFNARAYPAIIDGPEIVKGAVKGEPTPEKLDRAERIGKHMSYQLLQEMDDWEEDTDRLLIQLPIVGCAFRKTYFDPLKGYNCSHVISAGDFVVNYWTRDLESCPRMTHVLKFYPYEVREKMLAGTWRDIDLGTPQGAENDNDAPHEFFEQHRLLDLDDDDYPEPYIVTVHKETERVVRIVARFDERGVHLGQKGEVIRIEPTRVFTKYGFIPSPDGSFYDIGFGTLLDPFNKTINSTLNQLMDAGHLSNVQGGFIGAGVSIKSGNLRFQPGEWKKVDTSGQVLKDNIVPLPIQQPSAVLFNLLTFLVEAAKDVTATQDILGGDAGKGTMPVGTVSALIEQGLKTFTAIVKRIHRALKKELAILYQLNGRYLDPQASFMFQGQPGMVSQADYQQRDMDVIPVSDPNMATDMQRMAQAQFTMQFAANPMMDGREIIGRALTAARVPDPQALFAKGPPPPDPKMLAEQAKDARENRKIDIDRAVAVSTVANNMANAQATMVQAVMSSPQLQAAIAQLVDQRVAEAEGQQHGPGTGAVQPGDLSSVAGPPGQPPVPPMAPGPAGGPGAGMGGRGGDGPAPAMQGPPPGGVGGPGMG